MYTIMYDNYNGEILDIEEGEIKLSGVSSNVNYFVTTGEMFELMHDRLDEYINISDLPFDVPIEPVTYSPFSIMMALDVIGKLEVIESAMTAKERLLLTSASEIRNPSPEWALVEAFIAKAIEGGILTQEEVDGVLSSASL